MVLILFICQERLGPRVRLAVYLQQVARIHVRVALCGRQTGMTQKFLNSTEIRSSLKEVCGKTVPQSVWADSLGDRGLLNTVSNERPNASVCQSAAMGIDEQRVVTGSSSGTRRQVRLERLAGPLPERHDPFLASLPNHSHHPAVEVHLGHVQRDQLSAAKPGRVEQLEDRPRAEHRVPLPRDVEESGDLLLIEVRRQVAFDSGREEGSGRVPLEHSLAAQVTEKCPERCELPTRGGFPQAPPMQAREEGTDHQVIDVSWMPRAPEFRGEMTRELVKVLNIGPERLR